MYGVLIVVDVVLGVDDHVVFLLRGLVLLLSKVFPFFVVVFFINVYVLGGVSFFLFFVVVIMLLSILEFGGGPIALCFHSAAVGSIFWLRCPASVPLRNSGRRVGDRFGQS